MSNDDKVNIEILSKIVIQLKTSQTETTKLLNEEIRQLKEDSSRSTMELRERYDKEIFHLNERLSDISEKSHIKEKAYQTEIGDLKQRMETRIVELREDMLKLLEKYESKFNVQDDEIDVLKQKCEMVECKICNFQSFKVHFFNCEECNSSICSNCLQDCKQCKITRCISCLIKCKNCEDLQCKGCVENCKFCKDSSCKSCFITCYLCNGTACKGCLLECRKCSKMSCNRCSANCEKCASSVSCKVCFDKDNTNEKCLCGKLYCFDCEDECTECTIPVLWANQSRVFQGFHTISANQIPTKCLIKCYINHKGIDTSHIGLTCDSELKSDEKATDNFWSLCLNTGEKFSTSDYKKKGIPWGKYAPPLKAGDTVYIKFNNGEVKFLINRKEFPTAFTLDKSLKYHLYCLTHDDSTQVEIKSLKAYK